MQIWHLWTSRPAFRPCLDVEKKNERLERWLCSWTSPGVRRRTIRCNATTSAQQGFVCYTCIIHVTKHALYMHNTWKHVEWCSMYFSSSPCQDPMVARICINAIRWSVPATQWSWQLPQTLSKVFESLLSSDFMLVLSSLVTLRARLGAEVCLLQTHDNGLRGQWKMLKNVENSSQD